MIRNSSFRLANALLGLLVIILPFLGLPAWLKTIIFVIFGLLIILFSLAEIGGREPGPSDRPPTSLPEAPRENQSAVPNQ